MVKFHEERYWQKVMSLFCVHSTHSCGMWQIMAFAPFSLKKRLKKIVLRVRFLPLKIAFFWVFENYIQIRPKSHLVTKSRIFPQRKLGSL